MNSNIILTDIPGKKKKKKRTLYFKTTKKDQIRDWYPEYIKDAYNLTIKRKPNFKTGKGF